MKILKLWQIYVKAFNKLQTCGIDMQHIVTNIPALVRQIYLAVHIMDLHIRARLRGTCVHKLMCLHRNS